VYICTVVHVNCVDKKKEERNMYIRNKNKKRSEWIDDASVPTAHPHFPVQSYNLPSAAPFFDWFNLVPNNKLFGRGFKPSSVPNPS
jgi:hypothetical protein